ncbi:MAG TPA: glycoside hydrolase family 27 protein [Sedimentisphaerales bacterium]|nr:glycoside hydrolase family 27 protein [Sedimentisphaerales bacterium]
MNKYEFHKWAPTPPMGWNSWDCYGTTITEAEVKANADFMAERLRKHGWEYIVVDAQWFEPLAKAHGYRPNAELEMDEYGRLLPAVNRFPSAADGKGLRPLADYIHSKGLKFGIHIMRGISRQAVRRNVPILGTSVRAADIADVNSMCRWIDDNYGIDMGRPGAQEWYDSVFALMASWGLDYIKVDDISSKASNTQDQFRGEEIVAIRKAIDKCGRPMVLSLSPGPAPLEKAELFKANANLWRVSNDVWDKWGDILLQFDFGAKWATHSGPGHWPDADMLPLGRIGIRAERGDERKINLAFDEQRTMMTLWSICRSPLMFGGDLPGSDAATIELITNDEALAVCRHCVNNRQVYRDESRVVWCADIPGSHDAYVALFNLSTAMVEVSVKVGDTGISGRYSARDLWQKKDLGRFEGAFTQAIPGHGAGLYRLSPR